VVPQSTVRCYVAQMCPKMREVFTPPGSWMGDNQHTPAGGWTQGVCPGPPPAKGGIALYGSPSHKLRLMSAKA
jgi:hypothetical protein